jgi:ribosome biogenesis SPOUT family RNA methylase Rps3
MTTDTAILCAKLILEEGRRLEDVVLIFVMEKLIFFVTAFVSFVRMLHPYIVSEVSFTSSKDSDAYININKYSFS